MKTLRLIALTLMAGGCLSSMAQSTAQSTVKYFNIQKVVLPPDLKIVESSIKFKDTDGNNVINANEAASISLLVKNEGRGGAYGCRAIIKAEGTTEGLRYGSQDLKPIPTGESQAIVFPIQATDRTATGSAQFTILIDEPNGFGTDPVQLTVKTHKFDSPMVEIVSYKIVGDGDTQLRKKKVFKLQVLVQNTDQGDAKNVNVSLEMPNNMFNLNANQTVQIPLLKPNCTEMIEYELQTNSNIPDDINLKFTITESYGKYAKNGDIPLHFGQPISAGLIALNIQGQDRENVEITKGSLISDVDENIPVTSDKNPNMYAVIIANENYYQVASVPFALNDGNIFREYCEKTLGISAKRIHYVPNATLNQIKSEVGWLQNVVEAADNAKVIFYYAGHGIPDENNRSSYLLPVDGLGNDVSTGYKLDDLYAALGNMNSESVSVFMDACFSGSKRESGMLASARGVALKAKAGAPQGNMVVFSAAQGDETAYPYREQQHGLFTYYLLKKLQETAGNTTYDELASYISKKVRLSSVEENGKIQTPTTTASSVLGDSWKEWKLK